MPDLRQRQEDSLIRTKIRASRIRVSTHWLALLVPISLDLTFWELLLVRVVLRTARGHRLQYGVNDLCERR